MLDMDLSTIRVIFDLCEHDGVMKVRILQGQEISDWENGIDLISYIRQMRDLGYTDISQCGTVFLFRRPAETLRSVGAGVTANTPRTNLTPGYHAN